MSRAVVRWLLIVVGSAALAVPAAAAPRAHTAHVDKAVSRALAKGDGRQRVIVRTQSGGGGLLRHRLELRGKHVRTEHEGIDAVTVTLTASDVQDLVRDPSVVSISLDAELTADDSKASRSNTTTTTSPSISTPLPDGLRLALALGDYALGSTVGVAVIDSGLAD